MPADPTTLTTAVMIKADPTVDLRRRAGGRDGSGELDRDHQRARRPISGLPAIRLQATSAADASGYPVGTTRYGYLIDAGGRPVWIETSGTATDPTFATNVSVVDLIAAEGIILSPS